MTRSALYVLYVRDGHIARDLTVASSGAEFPVFVEQKYSMLPVAGSEPQMT